jgi:hypothetical protein
MHKHFIVSKSVGTAAFFDCLWIFFSDHALGLLFPDPEIFTRLAILKGVFFISVTSLLSLVDASPVRVHKKKAAALMPSSPIRPCQA